MMIKSIIGAAIVFFLSLPPAALGNPYQPGQPVLIRTETHVPEKGGSTPSHWRMVPEERDDVIRMRFYQKDAEKSFCRIDLSDAQYPVISETTDVELQIMRSDDFLVVPGFPVPCDILPVQTCLNNEQMLSSDILTIQLTAGARHFIERIRISCEPIDEAWARSAGWLPEQDPLPISLGGLFLVKVINERTRELIVHQLWDRGHSSWWLYEETPSRRSWRIFE